MSQEIGPDGIAVVGLAGRFPGAANVAQFWRNLCAGVESVSFFTDGELETSGIDTRALPPNYVKARAILDAPEWFDAGFFGFSPREAEILDPQQRVFLETAWEALEDAGCDTEQFDGSVGVFAGMANNTYYLSNLYGNREVLDAAGAFATMLANEKDFLATRTSYKLNLTGPSLNINTACSTSLVAVSQACHGLLSYQCDLALAGGVAVDFPQKKGALYQEGGTASSDGHCRAFDERANGMVLGEGVGVVALRRLADALADGDHVYAVIRGFAVNNDGAHKVGYAAPSVEGQAEVIALAQAMAAVDPETITYIEAHGTGTPLGDPIEIAGLTRAFRSQTNARGFCAIGSVKTNIGHLEAAAGVAGLIKTVLALRHRQLPPSLHFTKANPKIDFANSPFFVNDRLRDWDSDGPRRAGVSSFGIGGTNAHVVLEEAPVRDASGSERRWEILPVSAKSPCALEKASANLFDYLRTHPDVNMADVAYTLQVGRRAFPHRRVIVCRDRADVLRAPEDGRPLDIPADAPGRIREAADLWLRGGTVDWRAPHPQQRRHKVPLPTYPFMRQRYWIAPASKPPVGQVNQSSAPTGDGRLGEEVRGLFQELSGLSSEQMDSATTIAELGLDSLALAQASLAIERRFGVRIGFRELHENFPTFASLAEHLAVEQRPRNGATRPAVETRSTATCRTPASTERAEPTPEPDERVERLIERYASRTARSKRMAQEHRNHYVDPRVAAGFRQPWKEMIYPIVVERSSGSRLLDVDGNEYVDLVMGFGVNLFGHSPDFVTRAIREQLERGIEIGPQSPLAGQVAATLCRLTGAERAAFCNTGSEAVLAALRIARATTNRDKIALFAGSYHGIFDEVLVRAPTSARTQPLPIASGILPDALANVFVLEYGDPRSLDFIAEHSRDLAAVLVEPVQSRNPELQPGDFLHQLRRLTEDQDIALIFDEIITGFRCGLGGAQAHFGVRADIVTYGKVLGGGMPMGVVAGKSRFLDALDGGPWSFGDSSAPSRGVTYFAGTFVRHPLAIAAADAVLKKLDAEGPKLQQSLNERTAKLAETLGHMLADSGLPLRLGHFASLMYLRPTQPAPAASLLFYHLRAQGIHLWEGRPTFLSTAHTDEDLATIERAFADSIADLTGRTVVPVRPPLSAPGLIALPMTPAQTDLWITAGLGPGASQSYNLTYVIHARGPLVSEAMGRALQDLADRHEALRTTFDPHGRYQYIRDRMTLDVPLQDVSDRPPPEAQAGFEEAVSQVAWQPFDLENGPLLRARIVKLAAERHALLLTAHHLVLDGWSFGVLLEELGHLYTARLKGAAASLPPPLATRDYSRMEQEQRPPASTAQDYWLKQFAALPDPLELPTSRPRPSVRSYKASTERFVLGEETVARLRRASAKLGCGLMHLLLGSFSALLHRLSKSDDFVVGIPATSSLSDIGLRIRGDKSLVGDHVNLLPLRMRHEPNQTFEKYIRSIKELVLNGYENQNFTFAELVRRIGVPRDAGHVPLVSVTFNFDPAVSAPAIEGVETEVAVVPKAFDFFDLSVNVIEAGNELRVDLTFGTDLFDVEIIRAWVEAWRVLLDGVVDEPGLRLAEQPLLCETKRRQLVEEFNATEADYPHDVCLHELFEAQAADRPSAVAVIFGDRRLTFGELNDQANRLAHRLRGLGVGPDVCVGLCVEPSPEMVIGLLAILKAGGAYVPLDPAHPKERLAFLLHDARIAVLLSQERLRQRLPEHEIPIVCQDGEDASLSKESAANPVSGATARNLAHVLYTSGSTGTPKGVMGTHQGAVNRLAWMWRVYPFDRDEVCCQKTALTFVDSVWEIFGPLLRGVPLVVVSAEARIDPVRLMEELSRFGVSRLVLVPSLLRALLETDRDLGTSIPRMRLWVSSGETLSGELCRLFRQRGAPGLLVNLYGSTEAAGDSTCYEASSSCDPSSRVPIGRPIANTQVHVLDENLGLVPVGVVGELHIGGDGLARGYLGRPDLTAQKFVPDPFAARPGARLYRTGDLARWRADGNLEFLGRCDLQVKLRGFRIELGEIEATLAQHPAVMRSVVLAHEDELGDKRLIAYVVPQADATPEREDLRRFLLERLPEYMVPSAWVSLPVLPINVNGKVDRNALPAPESGNPGPEENGLAPRDPAEELLAAVWQEVLGLQRVGVRDNFFELGGHSLLAVKLFARLESVLGRRLPLATLFQAPTIERLAEVLRREDWLAPWSTLVAVQPRGQRPPFVCVHGLGGEVLGYRDLALQLGEDQPFYSFQAPIGQNEEELARNMESMAAAYLRELRRLQARGPYYLGGLSFGGMVAFEMAQQLVAQGETVALLALFDSYCPGHCKPFGHFRKLWEHGRKLRDLGPGEGLAFLRKNVLAQPQRLRRRSWKLASRVLARLGLSRSLTYVPPDMWNRIAMTSYRARPYRGQVTLFRAAERFGGNDRDPYLGWDRVALAGVVLEDVPGNHVTLLQEPNVRALAQRLRFHLEYAQNGTVSETLPHAKRRDQPAHA